MIRFRTTVPCKHIYRYISCLILGGLLCTVGFICAAFSSTIAVLVITYGLIGGVGSALIYMPGNYYELWRT